MKTGFQPAILKFIRKRQSRAQFAGRIAFFALVPVFAFVASLQAGAQSNPALEQLTGINGAAASESPVDIVSQNGVDQFSASESGGTAILPVPFRAIPPGSDLSPHFSDPVRVKVILKVIEDVYYERPLPFSQDGSVFYNREGLLPPKPAGYYREYTVLPPEGSPSDITVGGHSYHIPSADGHRGVERLVIGGGETAYYTPDHYKTFIQITVIR